MAPRSDPRASVAETHPSHAFRLGQTIASLAAEAERRERAIRVARASMLLGLVLGLGTYGYRTLTDGAHGWIECLYMTVVTVSTVGYGELIPANTDTLRLFNVSLILLGAGSILYFLTSVTAMVVEGDLLYRIWHQRTRRRLRGLRRHAIVCGAGLSGAEAVVELWRAKVPLVVIDRDASRVEHLVGELGEQLLFIIADALDEAALIAARVDRALGLLACLHDDRENLFLAISARQLNPDLRIVSKVTDPSSAAKLEEVGADATVAPSQLGGRALAHSLLDPDAMSFVDAMLSPGSDHRSLAVMTVEPGSPRVGIRLDALELPPDFGGVIVGLRGPGERAFRYHPPEGARLEAGSGLLVLGTRRELRRMERSLHPKGRSVA